MDLQIIQDKIYEIRGQRIMLDFDLAELYGTETKYLKRSVKNNLKRFPPDFMFELTKEEWHFLRCNFSTLNEDTRMQLELINQILAELQVKNREISERKRIGYQLPKCDNE